MLRKQISLLEKKKLLLPEVKQIFASRTQMLLSNHMFPSLDRPLLCDANHDRENNDSTNALCPRRFK